MDYYERKEQKNRELVECLCIFLAFMAVVAVGCALWQWVSPWAVAGWLGINVLYVVCRVRRALEYRWIKRRLGN